MSYQFGANYKITDKNLVRVVYSRAYKGPNMYDTYSSNNIYVGTQLTPTPFGLLPLPFYAQVQGNPDLKMQSVDMLELGYRVKATDNLYFDLEIFNQTTQNYSYLVGEASIVDPPSASNPFGTVTVVQSVRNIEMKAIQTGGTLSANFVLKKFQIKPFVTIQQTNLKKEPVYRSSVEADSVENISVTRSRKDEGTPSVYGGAYVNFQATPKFNINLNGYVFSNYTYTNIAATFGDNPLTGFKSSNGRIDVMGKVILNARISYKFFDKLDLFVNVRNLTNAQNYEFAKTDITKITILGGANFEF